MVLELELEKQPPPGRLPRLLSAVEGPGGCELELELEVAKQSLLAGLAAGAAGAAAPNPPRLLSGPAET